VAGLFWAELTWKKRTAPRIHRLARRERDCKLSSMAWENFKPCDAYTQLESAPYEVSLT
jgi:hypothetical protein